MGSAVNKLNASTSHMDSIFESLANAEEISRSITEDTRSGRLSSGRDESEYINLEKAAARMRTERDEML